MFLSLFLVPKKLSGELKTTTVAASLQKNENWRCAGVKSAVHTSTHEINFIQSLLLIKRIELEMNNKKNSEFFFFIYNILYNTPMHIEWFTQELRSVTVDIRLYRP